MNSVTLRSDQTIGVVDSHTGGEPTRVVIAGGPDLGQGGLEQRREVFHTRYDHFRSAVVNEPRGGDVLVGALLCEPTDPRCVAGVIFFNNVGYLNMCGHGVIGLAVTLAHLGRIEPGRFLLETPVDVVAFEYHGENRVTVENVPSYRAAKDVTVDVEGYGAVTGDVAWGGNWFFLVNDHREELLPTNTDRLTDVTWRIRQALCRAGITGDDGKEIDHIELFGPARSARADSQNFVLCPGKAYDRSPCGTGTSAKLACLIADGKLKPGETWQQESIIGSVFAAQGSLEGDRVIPRITGEAFITSEATLILQQHDPYRTGFSK